MYNTYQTQHTADTTRLANFRLDVDEIYWIGLDRIGWGEKYCFGDEISTLTSWFSCVFVLGDRCKTNPHIHSIGQGVFSWEEIRKHNKADDCWLVVDERVYDVTSFLAHHPAGSEAILRHAGQDSTVDFNFHSRSAQKLWKQFEIGKVEGSTSCLLM